MRIETNLQAWLIENEFDDTYLYKKAWWNVYVFVRDIIFPLIVHSISDYTPVLDKYGLVDWNHEIEYTNTIHSIIGSHYSKSLRHPVIQIKLPQIMLTFRCNFYDWEVMVDSQVPIYLPYPLILNDENTHLYYQGIPEEFIIHNIYDAKTNNKKFCYQCDTNYQFYAFMIAICDSVKRAQEEVAK